MPEWSFILMMTGYLAVMLIIGWRSRGSGNNSDYFLGSREFDGRTIGSSIGATVIGGSAVIATAAAAYTYGLPGIWYDLAGGLGLLFLGIFIAPRIRKTRAHSLPDLISINYGGNSGKAAAILLLMAEIGWIALLMQASRYVLSSGLSIDPDTALFIAAGVFVLYTAVGGQRAVIRTDVIQIVFILLTFVLLSTALFVQGGRIRVADIEFPVSDGFTPTLLLSVFGMMFLSHVVGPDIYSKVFSARSPSDSRKGSIFAGALKILIGLFIGLIVLMSFSLFGDSLAAGDLLPALARESLPPVLYSFVLIGLMSVLMSSADSCLISGSTFIAWDIIGKFRGSWIRIVSVLGLGSLSLLIAITSPGILSTLTLTYTLFSASMIPSVALLPWRKRLGLNRYGAVSSFVIGGSLVLLLYFLELNGIYDGELLFIPLFASLLTLLAVSRLTKKYSENFINRYNSESDS